MHDFSIADVTGHYSLQCIRISVGSDFRRPLLAELPGRRKDIEMS